MSATSRKGGSGLPKEGVFAAPLVQTADTCWGRVRFENTRVPIATAADRDEVGRAAGGRGGTLCELPPAPDAGVVQRAGGDAPEMVAAVAAARPGPPAGPRRRHSRALSAARPARSLRGPSVPAEGSFGPGTVESYRVGTLVGSSPARYADTQLSAAETPEAQPLRLDSRPVRITCPTL